MDAALELTDAVAIIILVATAEGITAGGTGSEAVFLATCLLAI